LGEVSIFAGSAFDQCNDASQWNEVYTESPSGKTTYKASVEHPLLVNFGDDPAQILVFVNPCH